MAHLLHFAIVLGGSDRFMIHPRFHLYEWFPKWYKSDGVPFKKLVPQMLYTNLVWKYDDGKKRKVSA